MAGVLYSRQTDLVLPHPEAGGGHMKPGNSSVVEKFPARSMLSGLRLLFGLADRGAPPAEPPFWS
jgi:hypothetical protein